MADRITVAALYVDPRGVYSQADGVELWGLPERDAREYAGPWPVVAHPPCERWGRYWHGGPSAKVRRKLGDDGGCFEHALWSVRSFGGVLEHPEASHAFKWFGLPVPPKSGGWIRGVCGGWSCCVEQGHYGHRARKATWLYLYGVYGFPPLMTWGKANGKIRLDDGAHDRKSGIGVGLPRITAKECAATPPAFRDLLLEIARSCRA